MSVPSILQDIQAEISIRIHIRMKHFGYEFYRRWLCRITLFELKYLFLIRFRQMKENRSAYEFECPVFKGGVFWTENDSIP